MSDLSRFETAQADTYRTALAELRAGAKTSHWMWFVFPQLAILGRSPRAKFFGLSGIDEARAYLAHPILGPRLIACAEALLAHRALTAEQILGPVDALKLRSCATLFRAAAADAHSAAPFQALLDRYFNGIPCALTLASLR